MPTEPHTTTDDRPVLAFVFTLLGGLFMLVSGPGLTAMMRRGMYGWANPGGHETGRWMPGHGFLCNLMPGYGSGYMSAHFWPWLGLLAGGVILAAAIVILARPESRSGWGITIIVSAALALLLGSSGLLAAALAIIGGILALIWKPASSFAGASHNTQEEFTQTPS